MESKSGFAVGGCGKASVSLVLDRDRHYFVQLPIISILFTVLAIAASIAGLEIFQPVFAEPLMSVSTTSDSVSMSTSIVQQSPNGNSYFRSMSESMSIIVGNGNNGAAAGFLPPVSYQRSMAESLSLTSMQGKVPNSYSRSMSEQTSLTTGMPSASSPVPSQPARVSSAPYSMGSTQRIEERIGLKGLSGGKGDSMFRGTSGGTSLYSTGSQILDSKMSSSTDTGTVIIQDSASVDSAEGEGGDHNNSVVRYVLANVGAAQYNAGFSQTNFFLFSAEGLVVVAIALRRSIAVSSVVKKIVAIYGVGVNFVTFCSTSPQQTTLQTRVIVILLVLFSTLAVASLSDPLFGQAAADTNNAGAAYRSNSGTCPTNSLNCPKYREYTASTTSWSSEVELPTIGENVRSVIFLQNPVNSQRVIIAFGTAGNIHLFKCGAGCTTLSRR